jgi:hypothetical protein
VTDTARISSVLLAVLLSTHAVSAQSLSPLNRELPRWLEFSGEYRARFEGFSNRSYQEADDDHYLLNRFRLNLQLRPASSWRIYVQTQDSRVFFNSRIPDAPPFEDSLDLRLAFLEVGDPEKSRFAVRAGRQEINLGEERLLGSSNWGNTARSFDAVRLFWRPVSKARFDVFASSVVAQADARFNRHVDGDVLHGLIGQIDWRSMHIEPFDLWRISPRVRSELGNFGKLDTHTFGARVTGKFNPRTEYVFEMAGQTGSWGADSVRAWAGHWRAVKTLSSDWRVPRIRVEYDYATGDPDISDGKHQTFELIYPTPHDKLGLADQVGWKNIHHVGATGEWVPSKALTLQLRYHNWYLASARDGVYNAGGALIVRDPTGRSGRHVGHEVDIQALGSLARQVKLGGGVGHIFTGEFLNKTTPGRNYTFPYVMLTWAF